MRYVIGWLFTLSLAGVIVPAVEAVRRLWDDFKPLQQPESKEDLSAYERSRRNEDASR